MIDTYVKEEVLCVEGTLKDFGRKVFVFLVDGMLIDTGPDNLEQALVSIYDQFDFDLVALTHNHEDHTGTANWIQDNFEVPIYLHPKGIELVKKAGSYPEYRKKTWGMRKPFDALPLDDTIRSRTLEWKVIYTPGHADDHVSFLNEATGRLFTGDLFVSPKTKVIMATESIPVIMDSLRKLLSYEFTSIFCSHAGYFEDGRKMLEMKLANLEKLVAEVKDLHNEGLSVSEINNKLFPVKFPIIEFSEGEWDSVHIITSILAK